MAADRAAVPDHVFHFSEDGGITRFEPHVPATNPTQRAAVWAIDAEHAAVYWFPRDCPRLSVWADDDTQRARLADTFTTDQQRLCVAESHRQPEIRTTTLYRYRFVGGCFEPWDEAYGQYVAHRPVVPESVDVFDDLLARHTSADHELRFVPSLDRMVELAVASGLPFSAVRLRNAGR